MKKILFFSSLPLFFILLALPVLALSDEVLQYTIKLTYLMYELREIIFKVILWFIFFTAIAFATYFITNTLLLIDNNRRYRFLLHMDKHKKTYEHMIQQRKALNNVKSSEKRLVLLGVLIAFFALLYLVFSAYYYLDASIVENMWPIIYYTVGGLVILVLLYSFAFLINKIKYSNFPTDDPESIQIAGKLAVIKHRIKLFVISIMLLILLYFTLLIVIVRGVKDLSS